MVFGAVQHRHSIIHNLLLKLGFQVGSMDILARFGLLIWYRVKNWFELPIKGCQIAAIATFTWVGFPD